MNRIITRLKKQAGENTLKSYFTGLGFKHVDTGGGCTAYQYDFSDGTHMWATDEEGINAVNEDTDIIILGWLNKDDIQEGVFYFDNLEEFKANINKFMSNPDGNFKDMF